MTSRYVYEYCLLRYVPDIERGEFVNVGLMVMCKRARVLIVRVHIDPCRTAALNSGADIELLNRQLRLFMSGTAPDPMLPIEERYRWLAAVKSAIIQTSPSHPGVVDADNIADLKLKLHNLSATLFDRLVASP